MFIVNITYKTTLEAVNQLLEQHIEYLDQQYELGHFVASGRKVPRTGGIILSPIKDKSLLENILAKDPFKQENIADYELIEFIPSKTSDALRELKNTL
mgnify:CR=1 FL=1